MFYAVFPVLKLVGSVPLTYSWRGWGSNKLYTAVGVKNITQQLMERYRLQEKKEKARWIVYSRVHVRSTYQTLSDDVFVEASLWLYGHSNLA